MRKTTVLIADDNSAVLEHVRKMLGKEKNYQVVAAISNGPEVVREGARLRPDVILLDISLGDASGIELAKQLRDAGCNAKIVFVTVHEDADYLNAAIGAGGSGYVVKSRLNLDLLNAINAALSDQLFVSTTMLLKHS